MPPRSTRRSILMLLPVALCWAAVAAQTFGLQTARTVQPNGVRFLVVGLNGAETERRGSNPTRLWFAGSSGCPS